MPLYLIKAAHFSYAFKTNLTVEAVNIICAPPALATLTTSVIAFRALYPLYTMRQRRISTLF
jgi:hypothetical protein